MKLDMNLIRSILLEIEASPTGDAPAVLVVEGHSPSQIGYHILLAIEAGLIVGDETTGSGDEGPMGAASRLTWRGHQFIEAAREPTRWNEARDLVKAAGGASIKVWIGVLTKLMCNNLGL